MLRDHGDVCDLLIKIIQMSSNDVTGLLVGDGSENLGSRYVIVMKRTETLKRIDEIHPS